MDQKSQIRTVLKNVILLTGSSVLSQVLLGVTGIVIVRYLGLSLYSEYATALLFMSAFTVLTRLGFNRLFLRECSKDLSQAPFYFASALVLNGGLTFVTFVIALTIAFFRYDNRIFTLTILLGSSAMLQGLTQTPKTLIQVHQKLHLISIIITVHAVLYFIAVFLGIYLKVSVFTLAGINLAMNIVRAILCCIMSLNLSFPHFEFKAVRSLLFNGLHFCAIDIVMLVYTQIHGFMLAIFNMGEQVGIFGVPSRLYAMIQMVAQIVDTAISPALYAVADTPERMIRGIKLSIRYFTVSGLFLAAVIFARAEWIITTLFKAEFLDSVPVLQFLGGAIACRFIVILLSHIIYVKNKERFMVIAMGSVATLSVIACLIVVPIFGAIGAGVTLFVSEAVLCLICLVKSGKLLAGSGIWKLFIMPLLSSVLTVLILLLLSDWPLLSVLISPIIFVGLLWAVGYYHWDEFISILKTLRKNR